MLQRMTVTFDATSSAAPITVWLTNAEASPIHAPISRDLPPAIDRGQAYYWSYAWQAGERESRKELHAGLGKTFENVQDALRWLLSADE